MFIIYKTKVVKIFVWIEPSYGRFSSYKIKIIKHFIVIWSFMQPFNWYYIEQSFWFLLNRDLDGSCLTPIMAKYFAIPVTTSTKRFGLV